MKTPDEIVDEGFGEIDLRLARLRLTATEMVNMSDTSYPTYWRCAPSKRRGHPHANINSRKKCLAALERALDAYEAKLSEAGA